MKFKEDDSKATLALAGNVTYCYIARNVRIGLGKKPLKISRVFSEI
jgi:hypothetical protein